VTAIAGFGVQVVRLEDYSLPDQKILHSETRIAEAAAIAR